MKKIIFISLILGYYSAVALTALLGFEVGNPAGYAKLFFCVVFTILFFNLGKSIFVRDKYCTWCGSRKLKYLKGETGEWFWNYRNKDGSQDKRVKNNFQLAKFISKWQCKKCDAVSRYEHYVDKKPSKVTEVSRGFLVSDGKGERSKTNYKRSKDSENIKTKSAYRKGDD
jgi:hypothetical protein